MIDLPDAIAAYFAADRKGDAAAIARQFKPDAIVVDEGNRYVGRDAIRQWIANASTQYSYTVEPFAVARHAERTVVTGRLVGNFPGSPIDLRYCFDLDGEAIARLEIVP